MKRFFRQLVPIVLFFVLSSPSFSSTPSQGSIFSEAEWNQFIEVAEEALRRGKPGKLLAWSGGCLRRVQSIVTGAQISAKPPKQFQKRLENQFWAHSIFSQSLAILAPRLDPRLAYRFSDSIVAARVVELKDSRPSDGSLFLRLTDVRPVKGKKTGGSEYLGLADSGMGSSGIEAPPSRLLPGASRNSWGAPRQFSPPISVLVMRIQGHFAGTLIPLPKEKKGFLGSDSALFDEASIKKTIQAWTKNHWKPEPGGTFFANESESTSCPQTKSSESPEGPRPSQTSNVAELERQYAEGSRAAGVKLHSIYYQEFKKAKQSYKQLKRQRKRSKKKGGPSEDLEAKVQASREKLKRARKKMRSLEGN